MFNFLSGTILKSTNGKCPSLNSLWSSNAKNNLAKTGKEKMYDVPICSVKIVHFLKTSKNKTQVK